MGWGEHVGCVHVKVFAKVQSTFMGVLFVVLFMPSDYRHYHPSRSERSHPGNLNSTGSMGVVFLHKRTWKKCQGFQMFMGTHTVCVSILAGWRMCCPFPMVTPAR